MNIRVDLNTPITDGTEVVFRSPVDCSQITGLIVYFKENGNTASKEFAFADAHGNNVGDIDHLFAENVVVKVILDVAHGMAFVQNADTNAYLEGRFDGIIDKLCPTFEETGLVVQCEPLEGTSLKATYNAGGLISITVCGKNLYDASKYPMKRGMMVRHGTGLYRDSSDLFAATKDFIPVSHLRGLTISLLHAPYDTNTTGTTAGIAFYTDANENSFIEGSGTSRAQVTVPSNADYMRFSIHGDLINEAQFEIGSAATDYEPYWERKATDYDSAVVIANKGINTVVGYDGVLPAEITVTGKADPVALNKHQDERIAKLEASLTALLEG